MRPHTPTDHEEALAALIVELTDRLQNGESLDQVTLAAQYPEFAKELREYLPSMQVLADLGRSDSPSSDGNGKHRDSPIQGTRVLGDFQIHRELGRGGMGVVYEAEQVSMGRRVALKVLPFATMVDEKAILRFKNEVRATATLHHPHIVPVFSVGEERGVHYYAMQLIKGHTLAVVIEQLRATRAEAQVLDGSSVQQALSSAEIGSSSGFEPTVAPGEPNDEQATKETKPQAAASTLSNATSREYYRNMASLGIEAADALQHAHEHGIVHRDIKPANLMLDSAGKLWITDFGLAHMESEAGMTMTGDLVGTLRYMSPEQALAKRIVIDNRTDIYSLGATLYEAIALQPMFDGADRQELLKQIALEESKPLRKIDRRIPVELETIIAKAVAKNPDDRYETASELADDLRRFLANEPITAKPPTIAQRVTKWSAHHKSLVTSVVVVLLIATIGLSVGSVLLDRERQRAENAATSERNQKVVAQEERDAAELARKRAETIKDFMIKSLRSPDPERDGTTIRVVEVLEQAETEIDTHFEDQPLVRADLLHAVGQTYIGLGVYSQAIVVHQRALAIRKRELGQKHSRTLSSMYNLASAYDLAGKYDEAIELSTKTLELGKHIWGEEHPRTLSCMTNLALAYGHAGRYQDALTLQRRILKFDRDIFGPEQHATLTSMNNLAVACIRSGRIDEAILLAEQTVGLAEQHLPREHLDVLSYMNSLGLAYGRAGQYEDAIEVFERILRLERTSRGPDHPSTLVTMNNLAVGYQSNGQYDNAIKLHKQALEISKKEMGMEHPTTLNAMNNLAVDYRLIGRQKEAIKLHKQALDLNKKSVGLEHPDTLTCMNNLVRDYEVAGQYNQSIELYEKSVTLARKILARDHPYLLTSTKNLARAYELAQRQEQAIRAHSEAFELAGDALGPKHSETMNSRWNLSLALSRAGRLAEAIEVCKEYVQLAGSMWGEDHDDVLLKKNSLAVMYWKQGNVDESIPLFEAVLRNSKEERGAEHFRVVANLGVNYLAAERLDSALHLLEEAHAASRLYPEIAWVGPRLMNAYAKARLTTEMQTLAHELLASLDENAALRPSQHATQLDFICKDLLSVELFADAELLARTSVEICEQHNPGSWRTFDRKCTLATALIGRGKYDEGESQLLAGYIGMKEREDKIPAVRKPRLIDCIEVLIQLYEKTDKPDEAAKWRDELTQLQAELEPETADK